MVLGVLLVVLLPLFGVPAPRDADVQAHGDRSGTGDRAF